MKIEQYKTCTLESIGRIVITDYYGKLDSKEGWELVGYFSYHTAVVVGDRLAAAHPENKYRIVDHESGQIYGIIK